MNTVEELTSKLHDLQLPTVSAWPAPGWWLLLLAIALLACFIWFMVRRYQQRGWQREARRELARLRDQVGHAPVNLVLANLSKLVRRVAMVARPRQQIASLHGELWLNELDDICGRPVFNNGFGQLLEQGPYQKNPVVRDEDLHALIENVEELISATSKHATPTVVGDQAAESSL